MSKALKKIIDINGLREFKNKLVGIGSAYVQTGAVDQTIAGTKTFSKPIVGSVTGSSGSCTGNAASANIATKATQDAAGNTITTTYATKADASKTYVTKTDAAKTFANKNEINDKFYTKEQIDTMLGSGSGGTGGDYYTKSEIDTKLSSIIIYDLVPDGAEAHNAMWGGRDITAAFDSGEFSEHVADGTFKDIFPGDYITKQVTISGTAYTVNWVIADCDYWWHKGDQNNGMETHHVVIVPQAPIFNANMNNDNVTTGGYAGSRMYKETIPACATGIVSAFGGDHILTFRDSIVRSVNTSYISSGASFWKGVSSDWGWYDAQCNLMCERMVYGMPAFSSSGKDAGVATRQMSAFRLSERLINYNRNAWLLRDVASSACFAHVGGNGYAIATSASYVIGVRPFALLK